MPYILPAVREFLDAEIDALATAINTVSIDDSEVSGNLNYAITKLIVKLIFLRYKKVRYDVIARFIGVLKNVSDEFYRRVATPYEDSKATINGDVYTEIL